MKTFLPDIESIERKWYVVDAQGQVLGRLASRVASHLMGKEKPCYTDFLDTGDFVVVINAEKVRLTGKKLEQKSYYSHSGYPGGLKEISARDLLHKSPEKLVEFAVKGMLPKTKMGAKMLRKLKVYRGDEHPHQAQQPEPLAV
jgi:large subunit ribosomal protein L13